MTDLDADLKEVQEGEDGLSSLQEVSDNVETITEFTVLKEKQHIIQIIDVERFSGWKKNC